MANLTEDIITNGCRDALITWISPEDGQEYLLDGHHRYEICKAHNIPCKKRTIVLPEGMEPEEWIIRNQWSRRNLNTAWRAKLALKFKKILEKEGIKRMKDGTPLQENVKGHDSARSAAKEFEVSHETIRKAEVIEREASEGQKAAWEAGEISTNALFNQLTKQSTTAKKTLKEMNETKSESLKSFLLGRIQSRREQNKKVLEMKVGVLQEKRDELEIEQKILAMVQRWVEGFGK